MQSIYNSLPSSIVRRPLTIGIITIIALTASCAGPGREAAITTSNVASENPFTRSLVYLQISAAPYDTLQPWKRAESIKLEACGTAVAGDLVLTTAKVVADATVIQAKKYGRNEFLPAERLVVDYDLNLCLIRISDDSGEPLVPVEFKERYPKNEDLTCQWLSAANQISLGRGYLDRAQMLAGETSFQKNLNFIVSNSSKNSSGGELFSHKDQPIGIACWSGSGQTAVIPAETINRFLAAAEQNPYPGFGSQGFDVYELLDPTTRKYLKMPEDMKDGVFISHVCTRGTGADVLCRGDALLAIDGKPINAYGRFEHPRYEALSLEYLIQSHSAGDTITFDVWRDGQRQRLTTDCRRFESADMLVPYQEYDLRPEYVVVGGCVFQKLTRPYLQLWGENWSGKTPPHLFHYYRDLALLPDDERSEIVILSYILPAPVNQGYQQLGRLVVSRCNGRPVKDMESFLDALEQPRDDRFIVIEFEMNNPQIVLPLANLGAMDAQINQLYGIAEPIHIRE